MLTPKQRLEVANACTLIKPYVLFGNDIVCRGNNNFTWKPEVKSRHLIMVIEFIAARSSGIRWLEAGKAIAEDDYDRLEEIAWEIIARDRRKDGQAAGGSSDG